LNSDLFHQIDAEKKIRQIVSDFYELVFSDVMIGHMFFGKDKNYLIDREVELASKLFGRDLPYSGKPLPSAHRHLNIRACQFDRRIVLLKKAFLKNNLDTSAIEVWLNHTESLRPQITQNGEQACSEPRSNSIKG